MGVCKVSNLDERKHKISEVSKSDQVTISPMLTILQLRQECKRKGLPQRGTKAELLVRLGWKKEDAEK